MPPVSAHRRSLVTPTLVALTLLALLLPVLPSAAVYTPPMRLSGDLVTPGAEVSRAVLSPDGAWVVLRADLLVDNRFELFAARLDGGPDPALVRLNDTPVTDGDVSAFRVTPDNQRVIFIADMFEDERRELFSAPIDGTAGQVRLSSTFVVGGDVQTIQVSSDSSRVVYRGDLHEDERYELYSAPIATPGGQLRLNDMPPPNGDVSSFSITSDSSRVVYRGELTTYPVDELYSAPIDAEDGQITLNDPPLGTGEVTSFRLTPDASRVVYRGDLLADEQYELYSAPVDAENGQLRLIDPPIAPGDVQAIFAITPDSGRAVYAGDLEEDGRVQVFAAPVDAEDGQVALTERGVPGSVVERLTVAPDGSRAVYTGDLTVDEQFEVYAVPLDGSGDPVRLSNTPVAGAQIFSINVAPDSSRVVYVGDLETDNVRNVYSAPLDAAGGQTRLNDPLSGDQDVFSGVSIAPDSSRVVYGGDLLTENVDELFSAPIDQAGQQVRVNAPFVAGGNYDEVEMAPDSSFVIYEADQVVDDREELFASGVGQLPAPPPTDLAVSDVTETTATLTWTGPPPTSQVTGFRVEVTPTTGSATTGAPATGSAARAAAVAPEDTPTTVTGTSVDLDDLDSGTTYEVSVATVNDAGASEPVTTSFTTAGDPPETGVVRRAGDDRFETAALASAAEFDPGVDLVVVATGADFPDALAGAPFATVNDAPILLTRRDSLPEATAAELERLTPGAIVVLGGDAAVANDLLPTLQDLTDGDVTRIAGDNRYETAAAIADTFPAGSPAYLATGTKFPDALAGAAAAGRDAAPILLTLPDRLPDASAEALDRLAPPSVTGLGGASVVADDVLDAVGTVTGVTPTRLAGDDRFDTSAVVAATFTETGGSVYVATGLEFPDALAAGPLAGAEPAPILLTRPDQLPDSVVDEITRLAPRRIVVLGGNGAVSSTLDAQLATLLGG